MKPTGLRARSREEFYIGLISGTSSDGVEASLVAIAEGGAGRASVRLVAHRSFPFSDGMRRRILRMAEAPGTAKAGQSTAELATLHHDLGGRFAAAAIGVARRAGVKLSRVTAIGSHGQTVCHRPLLGSEVVETTLQIGEPAVIAERTGVTTVADFRPADMAAGGLGAPLTPYPHGILFARPDRAVLVVNLGGIANLTWIPAGFRDGSRRDLPKLRGFDTGPANMLLDGAMVRFSRGRAGYDRDGALASRGRVEEKLLCHLMAHPFIRRKPPKATGREDFGAPMLDGAVRAFLRLRGRKAMRFDTPVFHDFLATLAAYTARSIGKQAKRFLPAVGEVVVCGGGAKNPVLVEGLRTEFPGVRVVSAEDRGVPAHAVEAVSFALLARAALLGVPANVPGITGARRPVVLGKVVPGGGGGGPSRGAQRGLADVRKKGSPPGAGPRGHSPRRRRAPS